MMYSSELSYYEYFNAHGQLITESQGLMPETEYLNQAHYVVQDGEKMIKNADAPQTIEADIEAFRKELVAIPISNISEIMRMNKIIGALDQYLCSLDPVR